VTWKLKTNRPERYLARPKYGVLLPGEKATVKVQVSSNTAPKHRRSSSRDQILIFATTWNTGLAENSSWKKTLAMAWKELEQKHNPKIHKYAYQVIALNCKASSDPEIQSGTSLGPEHFQYLKEYMTSLKQKNVKLEERLKLANERTMKLERAVVSFKMFGGAFSPMSEEKLLTEHKRKSKLGSGDVSREILQEAEDSLIYIPSGWHIKMRPSCLLYIFLAALLIFVWFINAKSIVIVNTIAKERDSSWGEHKLCFVWDHNQAKEVASLYTLKVLELSINLQDWKMKALQGLQTLTLLARKFITSMYGVYRTLSEKIFNS